MKLTFFILYHFFIIAALASWVLCSETESKTESNDYNSKDTIETYPSDSYRSYETDQANQEYFTNYYSSAGNSGEIQAHVDGKEEQYNSDGPDNDFAAAYGEDGEQHSSNNYYEMIYDPDYEKKVSKTYSDQSYEYSMKESTIAHDTDAFDTQEYETTYNLHDKQGSYRQAYHESDTEADFEMNYGKNQKNGHSPQLSSVSNSDYYGAEYMPISKTQESFKIVSQYELAHDYENNIRYQSEPYSYYGSYQNSDEYLSHPYSNNKNEYETKYDYENNKRYQSEPYSQHGSYQNRKEYLSFSYSNDKEDQYETKYDYENNNRYTSKTYNYYDSHQDKEEYLSHFYSKYNEDQYDTEDNNKNNKGYPLEPDIYYDTPRDKNAYLSYPYLNNYDDQYESFQSDRRYFYEDRINDREEAYQSVTDMSKDIEPDIHLYDQHHQIRDHPTKYKVLDKSAFSIDNNMTVSGNSIRQETAIGDSKKNKIETYITNVIYDLVPHITDKYLEELKALNKTYNANDSIIIESGEIISGDFISQEIVSGHYDTYEITTYVKNVIHDIVPNITDKLLSELKSLNITYNANDSVTIDSGEIVSGISVSQDLVSGDYDTYEVTSVVDNFLNNLIPRDIPKEIRSPVIRRLAKIINRSVRIYHVPGKTDNSPNYIDLPNGRKLRILYAGPGITPGTGTNSKGVLEYIVLP